MLLNDTPEVAVLIVALRGATVALLLASTRYNVHTWLLLAKIGEVTLLTVCKPKPMRKRVLTIWLA